MLQKATPAVPATVSATASTAAWRMNGLRPTLGKDFRTTAATVFNLAFGGPQKVRQSASLRTSPLQVRTSRLDGVLY